MVGRKCGSYEIKPRLEIEIRRGVRPRSTPDFALLCYPLWQELSDVPDIANRLDLQSCILNCRAQRALSEEIQMPGNIRPRPEVFEAPKTRSSAIRNFYYQSAVWVDQSCSISYRPYRLYAMFKHVGHENDIKLSSSKCFRKIFRGTYEDGALLKRSSPGSRVGFNPYGFVTSFLKEAKVRTVTATDIANSAVIREFVGSKMMALVTSPSQVDSKPLEKMGRSQRRATDSVGVVVVWIEGGDLFRSEIAGQASEFARVAPIEFVASLVVAKIVASRKQRPSL